MVDLTPDLDKRLARQVGSQAAHVEQARAVAEVQAAAVLAQQVPRDETLAIAAMRRSCTNYALASRAFYSYRRGSETISGATVQLARELARIWGNVQYGMWELSRDDTAGVSEMMAWAWDVQTNVRAATTFLVPHARDTKRGRQAITDLRDVYENNANAASRRVREQIFAILPSWYVAEAEDACRATVEAGKGHDIDEQRRSAIAAYESLGVPVTQLEAHIGRPAHAWAGVELADLEQLYRSLRQRTITREEAFGPEHTDADAVLSQEVPV